MTGSFLTLFRPLRHYLAAALVALCLLPGAALAQSACTAMWAIVTTGGAAPTRLAYFNNSAGTTQKFTTLSFTLAGGTNANALAGDPATGILYYYDRMGLTVNSANLNTGITATVGTITPASPNGNANIIGAYIDASSNLIMMSTSGPGGNYQVAAISKAGNTTNAVWRTVTYTVGGGLPASGGSGDLYLAQSGQAYLITNTTPGAIYPLSLTITPGAPNGTITASTVGASTTFATSPALIAGVSLDPNTGINYFGGATSAQIAHSFNPAVANSEVLVDSSAGTVYTISDMGNCVLPPARPTVSKSFSPTYAALTASSTTLVINFGNSNTVPIWLNRTFTDQLPAGLTVAATPALNSGACAASPTVTNVITATAGQTTLTFANGGRIPAGGCTISFSVTGAAQANGYTNTIAIGSLTTTSGSNTVAATATYKVGTDFITAKTEGTGTTGPYTAGPLTVPGGTTMQYILTVTNSSSGGTGSATFTDTLPTLITPVLTITAGLVGGGAGTCVVATSTVAGATRITGTLTNVIAGAVCSITVTTKVSAALAVATTTTNTFTLAPLASTSDTNPANNTASVLTTVGPSANITIGKTNGTTTVASGSTTSYTLTIANLGPADASGSIVKDPAVAGLNCTTVTCTSTAPNMCPASPTISALQGAGLQISPTFAASTTASFVVTCGVTATGF